jgi:hypothetical protein
MIKKKKDFIEMYKLKAGHIADTCKAFNVDRGCYYDWMAKDPEFKQAIHDADEAKKDWIESMALKRISEASDTMLIFYMKTKLKDRGYIERQEVEHSGEINILNDIQNAYNNLEK